MLGDEFASLLDRPSAMGLAHSAGEEAKTAFRAQADRFAAEMDLVRKDEFDALKAEVAALRAELATLKGEPETKPKKPQKGTSTDGTRLPDAAG